MTTAKLKRVVRRLRRTGAQAIPTVIAVVMVNFALLQLVPGDAADVLAGESGAATAETMTMMRHHFGLDLTRWQQLVVYLKHLSHFSLGFSPRFNTPVMTLIMDRLPNTLILMTSALVFAIVVGITIGVAMATWAGKWPDRVLSFFALLLYSVPGFWLALMAIVLFSVKLNWLPNGGDMTLGVNLRGWSWFVDRVWHAVMPALALASFFVAIYARLTRIAMLEVQRHDYVRTAQAKGVHPFFVTVRHVLRNALIPITTVAGMDFGSLLGGAAVIETVFNWPGLGRLALEAVQGRDYNVLLGVLLLSSMLVIVANVLVDLLHTWLDPRIALQ